MHTTIIFLRTVGLLGVLLMTLSACGGGESVASPTAIQGSALIFFYTDNWVPWAQTAPIVDGLEQTYGTRLRFVRIDFNSPEGQVLAARYQVRSHPTILTIDRAGTARATLIGIPTRERVEQAIQEVVP